MKIVFLDRYSIGDTDLTPISSLGDYTEYEETLPSQVVERCAGVQIVITNKVCLFKAEMDALPELKLICVAATGTNNIDTEYAAQLGIKVMNVPSYSTQSVAEATFAMVLTLLRNVTYYDSYVKDGSYGAGHRCFNLDRSVSQISGKRWGIIGMGNIGRRVAEIAQAFSAEICYYSTSGRERQEMFENVSLDELLTSCDIISVHCPLNERTNALLSYAEISKMRPTAVLINVSRGGIVVESDLARALDEGLIAAAGLDVFQGEPIDNSNPLLEIKDSYKLVLAPHCAWSSQEAREVLVSKTGNNIRCFLESL